MASVQILLIEDVFSLGRSGEIVTVKSGYARNYLFPRKKAVLADSNAMRMQESLRVARAEQAARDLEEAKQVKARLDGQTFSCERKVDPDGHMYGSVAVLDIVEIVKEQLDIELDKNFIILPQAIKQVGIHNIPVRLKEDVECSFVLKVIPEGGELPEETEATEEDAEAIEASESDEAESTAEAEA